MKRQIRGGETGGEAGFSLVELVMVVVIVGILSAVFITKFLNLSSSARQAVLTSAAFELTSAGKMNSAECTANNNDPSISISGVSACIRIRTCADASNAVPPLVTLPKGSDNKTLVIGDGPTLRTGVPVNGELIPCTLNEATPSASGTSAANFFLITAGN